MATAAVAQKPRGSNIYAVPTKFTLTAAQLAGPSPFTRAQLEAFFSNVPYNDIKQTLITAMLAPATLQDAIGKLLSPIGDLYGGFKTVPPMPINDMAVPATQLPLLKVVAADGTSPTVAGKGTVMTAQPGGGSGGGGRQGQPVKQQL